jgi:hypothetical protein
MRNLGDLIRSCPSHGIAFGWEELVDSSSGLISMNYMVFNRSVEIMAIDMHGWFT